MASLMILLTAVDEGLGACLVGIMSDADPATLVPSHTAAFKREFGIPDEYDPIGAITVGHRAPRITPAGGAHQGDAPARGGGHPPRSVGHPRMRSVHADAAWGDYREAPNSFVN